MAPYGVLQNARRVNGKEALTKLSDIQLGVDLNILPQWGKDSFNELIAITRPNFLSKYAGNDNLTDIERDSYRAKGNTSKAFTLIAIPMV